MLTQIQGLGLTRDLPSRGLPSRGRPSRGRPSRGRPAQLDLMGVGSGPGDEQRGPRRGNALQRSEFSHLLTNRICSPNTRLQPFFFSVLLLPWTRKRCPSGSSLECHLGY